MMLERIILSSFLLSHEFAGISLERLMNTGICKEWFRDERHRIIFEVLDVCYKGSVAFDNALVIRHLQKDGVKNASELVLDIISQKPAVMSVLLEHIKDLKQSYHKRKLLELSDELKKMLADESSEPQEITTLINATLSDFEFLNNHGYTKNLEEVRKERLGKPPVSRIRTYIPFIDTVLTDKQGRKGIRNEGLMFISGKKQSGKTFILTRLIENVSREHPVMFGSMEFGVDLYDENIEQQQKEKFFNGNLKNIYVFDEIYETDRIISEIRFMHKLHGIKLVALDSMMRMTNNNPNLKTDERRISEMFSKLGKLSKELKLPIIVVVQSSKEDLKSSVISVKGSMNADHEAYVWFHLVKTYPKENENEQRTVIWNKNKDTMKHPKQQLMFVPETSDFYRVEIDEHGHPCGALDKYRAGKPKPIPVEVYNYEGDKVKSNGIQMPII